MPIEYSIDHARRLVTARGHGVFSDADVFGYQLDVGSRSDVAGYDELIDMTDVEHIALPSIGRIRQLAELGVKMDSGSSLEQSLPSSLRTTSPSGSATYTRRIAASTSGA